jgi:hypothetical protein
MNFLERILAKKVLTNMLNNVLSHWKTTAAGLTLAILQVVLNGRSTKELAAGLAVAILGAIAKDPGEKK